MTLERIVALIISLLEDQEQVKISYTIEKKEPENTSKKPA